MGLQEDLKQRVPVPSGWQSLEHPSRHEEMLSGVGFCTYALRVRGLEEMTFGQLLTAPTLQLRKWY